MSSRLRSSIAWATALAIAVVAVLLLRSHGGGDLLVARLEAEAEDLPDHRIAEKIVIYRRLAMLRSGCPRYRVELERLEELAGAVRRGDEAPGAGSGFDSVTVGVQSDTSRASAASY